MKFKVEEIPAFLILFEEKRALIAGFPGCQGVQLLNDVHSLKFTTPIATGIHLQT